MTTTKEENKSKQNTIHLIDLQDVMMFNHIVECFRQIEWTQINSFAEPLEMKQNIIIFLK